MEKLHRKVLSGIIGCLCLLLFFLFSCSGIGEDPEIEDLTLTISSTAENPTSTTPIPISFVFNKDVTGFEQSDISVTNGTASDFTVVSPSEYTSLIRPSSADSFCCPRLCC